MPFDFDSPVDRRATGSLKWEKYAGRDILPLWVADMDFRVAPPIREALAARVAHGVFGYTVPDRDVVEAVLAHHADLHGWAVDPAWLVWLPGLVPGLNLLVRAFVGEGEGVLACPPVYPPFLGAPTHAGRALRTAPLREVDGRWENDWEALTAAAGPGTRLFFLCHPHNPVGRAWRPEELERLAEFSARHDLVVCSDEIHCDLVLEDRPHRPFAALGAEAARRTIALYAPSKTYNVPGLSCAYAVIPNDSLRRRFTRAIAGIVTEINAFGLVGCAAAYRHGEPWRRALLDYLRGNRDLVRETVATRLAPLRTWPVEATYLAWIDARALGHPDPVALAEAHGVGLSDGAPFGSPGFLRLNFGCPRSVLREALTRLERAVACPPQLVPGDSPPIAGV